MLRYRAGVSPERIDERLQRYRIIEKTGAGGTGEIYRAIDTQLDRDVAAKFVPAELSKDTTSGAELDSSHRRRRRCSDEMEV